jgi:hypothetical protein
VCQQGIAGRIGLRALVYSLGCHLNCHCQITPGIAYSRSIKQGIERQQLRQRFAGVERRQRRTIHDLNFRSVPTAVKRTTRPLGVVRLSLQIKALQEKSRLSRGGFKERVDRGASPTSFFTTLQKRTLGNLSNCRKYFQELDFALKNQRTGKSIKPEQL